MMRKFIHKWAWSLIVAFCAIGLVYPVVGAVALVCMLAPVVTAFFKGRFWCGNFCPRGSFNDMLLSKISLRKPIPGLLKKSGFRIGFLILLMSAFAFQLYMAWGSFASVGVVFVRMIIMTTLLGIVLGILYNHRTWCVICPMGTMAHFVAKIKAVRNRAPHITFKEKGCVNCKICTKNCPVGINVHTHRADGKVLDSNCLKCNVCVEKCPKKALNVV